FPRRRVLMVVALGAAGCAVLLGVLTRGGHAQLWQVALVSLLSGAVFVFDTPARGALLVDLAGRDRAHGALALNAVAGRLFGAVGAFAGGAVIETFGVSNGY